jgi:hypothetical protein
VVVLSAKADQAGLCEPVQSGADDRGWNLESSSGGVQWEDHCRALKHLARIRREIHQKPS